MVNARNPEPSEALWSPDPIVGFRGWNVTPAGELKGQYSVWPSEMVFAEHHDDPGRHRSPDWECLCGVNAYKDVLDAARFPILGQVELSGLVIEYEAGYRGEVGLLKHAFIYVDVVEYLNCSPDDIQARYPAAKIEVTRRLPKSWLN